ncbi:hypothetical protein H0H87_006188 [Tephrocybe sp. NHM501043]|nr:hypothetical protein H0H87_006188 [Tephrocybe sp. NHM501043]
MDSPLVREIHHKRLQSEDDYPSGIHHELNEPISPYNMYVGSDPNSLLNAAVGNSPATFVPVEKFEITSRSFPRGSAISVSRPEGGVITVQNVIINLLIELQRPLPPKVLHSLEKDIVLLVEAQLRRTSRIEKGDNIATDICWIDLLPEDDRIFVGLGSREQSPVPNVTRRVLKVA